MLYVIIPCTLLLLIHSGQGTNSRVKTIKTEYGDIYDCVDFYNQLAFNHPLLRNHTFHPQMRPSSRPKRRANNNTKMGRKSEKILLMENMKLKDGGCPIGTVPIPRLNPNSIKSNTNNGAIFAVSETKSDPSRLYNGVGATLSVYNPRVLPSQYSSGEIIIKGGSDSIQVGWTVNPNVYNDNHTRFFIYTVAGDKQCFGSECGFVIVRSDIPLDFVMWPISIRGGPVFINEFFVYKDEKNGNWWLEIGADNIILGFWPQEIFAGLAKPASYAACGGEVNEGALTLPPPEMGSGFMPYYAFEKEKDAYCKEFVVVDEGHNIVDVEETELYANSKVYIVIDRGINKGYGRLVSFGGPTPIG